MDNPSWMGQRNAWQQAHNSWQQQNPNSSYGQQGGVTLPSPPVAAPSLPPGYPQHRTGFPNANMPSLGQNWFQQNRPALEAFFSQMGMKPQGLFPFNPTGFGGPKTSP